MKNNMSKKNMGTTIMSIVRYFTYLTAFYLLTGCGGGSGATTTSNPVTSTQPTSSYTGPAPQTADIQQFKLNIWDNLSPTNRCGSCHDTDQAPRFVRSDDINLAYAESTGLINLSDPGASRLVEKVRTGHNCWLTDANACGDIVQAYITAWAGGSSGDGNLVQLTAPTIKDPGSSKNFPESSALFAGTVHPLLEQYCSNCHSDTATIPQSPYFASEDADTSYEAAQSKLDLETPASSRLVIRLSNEFHNCWSNCSLNATEMEDVITQFAGGITPTQVDPSLVTSKALNLTDGIVASSGGRHETNLIAKYEFKTGDGNQAFDTSGIEPAANMTLSGDYEWVGGWGVQLRSGKAQASTTTSQKIHGLITATGEYSIEAWIVPANVTQEGPARIVTYSGGTTARNFTMGQTLYNYDFLNRNADSDANGDPALSTADGDEDLQATLQHVVLTYDPANGRRIYVNGEFTDDVDANSGSSLSEWDDTFALAIGSEVDGSNAWAGTVRLLAIHNRVLNETQITQNFDAGVGEKFFLLFNVSDHVNIDSAYIVLEVSQYDSYSYLFNTPFFTILNSATMPSNIPVQKMRIGINGREALVGQAYRNIDMTITEATYSTENKQAISTLGAVIALEKGPQNDEFFLTFELLGDAVNVVTEPVPPTPAIPPDVARSSSIGLRTFDEINLAMSSMTTVPRNESNVFSTFTTVKQQMPSSPSIEGFLSSQQMGVTQLAIEYCNSLVENGALSAAYFPDFANFGAPVATAFSTTGRANIINPLLDNMIGTSLSTQPDRSAISAEINALTDRLTACAGSCPTDHTRTIIKANCAAVLGSAAMLLQ
ncbi:MAG: LamG domain-containing protein [Pseudomonadales bacterium]|nr:LamG domain-containing protein [Pseudomonadales bacterium]